MTKSLANFDVNLKSCSIELIVLFNSDYVCLGAITANESCSSAKVWENASGKSIERIIASDDFYEFKKQFATVLQTGSSNPFCINLRTKGGFLSVRGQLKQTQISITNEKSIAWHQFAEMPLPANSKTHSSILINATQFKQTIRLFEDLFQFNTLPLILVNQKNLNLIQANAQAIVFLGIEPSRIPQIKLSDFSDLPEDQFKVTIDSFVNKNYTGLELSINTMHLGQRDVAFHYSFVNDEIQPKILFALVDVSDRNHAIREVSRSRANLSDEVKRQTDDLIRINNSLIENIKKGKKTEVELRQSKEMFFRLFQSNPNGMVLRHLDTLEIFEVNESFLKTFNFSKSDVVDCKIEELGIHCNPAKYSETLARLIQQKVLNDLEMPMTSKQGHARFVQYSGEVITLEKKKFILEVYQDITNFQITQQKLIESEERYRSMFNNALVGFYRTEIATGIVLDCNVQYARILGYNKPSEIIGHSLIKHYTNERNREIFLAQLIKKKILVYEHLLKANNEKNVWVVNYAQIFPNYGFIDGVVIDITDRKLMEDMLTYSENRFRSMIENATDLIIIIDSEGNGLYFSPSIMRELGYNVNSTTKASILDFLSSDDKVVLHELLKNKFSDKKTLEVNVKHANGTFRTYELVIANLLSDPTINGYVLNARDITNQIKARNEIDIALAKEQEFSRLKTQFIATVSHEFRTPLTNISLNIQLLEKYVHDRNFEKTEGSLERMNNAVKRLVALLNEVSLISKDQSGKLLFSPSEVDVYELLKELIDQQSYLILPYVEVKVIKGKRQNVLVDKNLLQHILGNLISNAVKYSPEKKPITINISNINNSLEMKVKDNGIGIPTEEIHYLFDPYFRASNVNQIPGTGLGLSIVKKCVELHNGTIEVTSEPKIGTEITCTIPLNFCE